MTTPDPRPLMASIWAFPRVLLQAPTRKLIPYVKQLRPLSPTEYMFCPIGGDFNSPVKDLPTIIENYNKTRYPKTGVYAVFATLEDYLKLVEIPQRQIAGARTGPEPVVRGLLREPARNQAEGAKAQPGPLACGKTRSARSGAHPARNYPDFPSRGNSSLFSDHHDLLPARLRDRAFKNEQIPVLKKAQDRLMPGSPGTGHRP